MSRVTLARKAHKVRFPRSRGDEPGDPGERGPKGEFSPLTRG